MIAIQKNLATYPAQDRSAKLNQASGSARSLSGNTQYDPSLTQLAKLSQSWIDADKKKLGHRRSVYEAQICRLLEDLADDELRRVRKVFDC
jgi:hypothetical protein